MDINLIVVTIVALTFAGALLATIAFAYHNIVKSKKNYSRQKPSNGDIFLDDVCEKYLVLSNLHIPNRD